MFDISTWVSVINTAINVGSFLRRAWRWLTSGGRSQLIPETAVAIVPQPLLGWSFGKKGNQDAAISVVGDFYFTNASAQDLLLPGTRIVAFYRKWWLLPAWKRATGVVTVKHPDPSVDLYDHYPIPPGHTTLGRAFWIFEPPFKSAGQNLLAKPYFTDSYKKEHSPGLLKWRYLG